jgi:hypothetical protein
VYLQTNIGIAHVVGHDRFLKKVAQLLAASLNKPEKAIKCPELCCRCVRPSDNRRSCEQGYSKLYPRINGMSMARLSGGRRRDI